MIQGSEEWHLSRIGNLTASRCHEAVAKTKSGYSASRQKLMDDLVSERLTGERRVITQSAAMQWGVETEPLARQAYELIKGCDVYETGSVPHPLIEESSASPDGLVGDNGLIEIKCPNTTTMVNTVIKGEIPENYKTQMMWQLACTQRDWCDFVMYDPRLPDERNIWIKRFSPSQEEILALELKVIDFLHEVRERVNMFKQISGG
jgi:putative phage-type endonuclease